MNIENVVKGLECCTERDKCDKKCPYWNSDKSCWINLKKDALALLKAQNKDAEIIRKCREGKVLKHVGDGVVVLNYDWWHKMVEKCDHIKIVPSVGDLRRAHEPKLVHVTADINHRKIGECPNCGKLINSGDYMNFCGQCGQAVKWE